MLVGAVTASQAGTATTMTEISSESDESAFAEWWNGKQMTGDWFGLRGTLGDRGLSFSGKWNGAFYGVIDSQGGQRGFFDQEVGFAAELDFAKFFNNDALDGLTAFGGVRWRDSRANSNPNEFVEATGNFQPSHYQSGTQWRLLTFGLEYATPELFGVEEFLKVRGGWLQPQKEFIDQPLSKLFVNNAFESSKGIGQNIPFSSSFSTWGGTLQVRPVELWYLKGGLFMSYPRATSSSNHGLAMEGYGPDPSRNGVMFMGETGVTPKFGSAELSGKYAFGGYYYGEWADSFFGERYPGRYGFYWQADQMLYREPSPEPELLEKGPSDGKTMTSSTAMMAGDAKAFKEPVSMEKPKLSDQGLSFFSLITYAPKYNNSLPFYFHTGLVYKGLIPGRDKDLTMFAFGYGQYSFYQIEADQAAGEVNQSNYTAVLEWDYRIQINGWAYFQPYAQYIVRPNGTGAVGNAAILGFLTGVTF